MTKLANTPAGSMEHSVRRRYAESAVTIERDLCCPSCSYDETLLANVPAEVAKVDYGCGDPTRWVSGGQTVLDLGCGSGKVCYVMSQIVGRTGHVIGVDFNEPMLAIARRHQSEFAGRVGFDNMSFKKGRIQDLALDLDALEAWLREHPVSGEADYLVMEEFSADLRSHQPMIASESVDCVVSNCVLNLVQPADRDGLFAELHRVLKRGGYCVISDIVSDEDVPMELQRDPKLWSGCISGAFCEEKFLQAFERAGFYGIQIVSRTNDPWRVVEGIEFRSVTVRAFKGKEGPCLERNQAVVYKGPWKSVTDDDGHTLQRGQPMAVCDKTFSLYTREPYASQIVPVPPHTEIPLDRAKPFDCSGDTRRDPRETKGLDYTETTEPKSDACCADSGCC